MPPAPPLLCDRSYTVEELSLLPYRALQQLAKSMALPCNVKKVILIELINAKTTKSQTEIDAIVLRVKHERMLTSQTRKQEKKAKLEKEASTIAKTQPKEITPKVRKPSKYVEPESLEFNENSNSMVTQKVKQPVSPRNTSDRVLRSKNVKSYKRPNYCIINDPVFEENEKLQVKKEPECNVSCLRRAPRMKPPVRVVIQRQADTDRMSLLKKPLHDDDKKQLSLETQTNDSERGYSMQIVSANSNKYTKTYTKHEPDVKKLTVDNHNNLVLIPSKTESQFYTVKQETSKYQKISKVNTDVIKRSARRTDDKKVTIQEIINYDIDGQSFTNSNMKYKREDLKNERQQTYQKQNTEKKYNSYQTNDNTVTYINKSTRRDTGYESEETSFQGNAIKNTNNQMDRKYQTHKTDNQWQASYYQWQNVNYKRQAPDCKRQTTDYKRQVPVKWQNTDIKYQNTKHQNLQRYYPNMSASTDVKLNERKPFGQGQNNTEYVYNKIRAIQECKASKSSVKPYKLQNQYNMAAHQSPVIHDVFGQMNESIQDPPYTQPLYVECDNVDYFGADSNPALLVCPSDGGALPELETFSALRDLRIDTEPLNVQVSDSDIYVEVPPIERLDTTDFVLLHDMVKTYSNCGPLFGTDNIPGIPETTCKKEKPLPKINEAFSKFEAVKDIVKPFYNDTANDNTGEVIAESAEQSHNYSLKNFRPVKKDPMEYTSPIANTQPALNPEYTASFEQDKDNYFSYTLDEVSGDLVPYIEQEITLGTLNEGIGESNFDTASQCSQESLQYEVALTEPQIMEESMDISQGGADYMAGINTDVRMRCVLCYWEDCKSLLLNHIREDHATDINIQGNSEWAVTFVLGSLAADPVWMSHVFEYAGQLYIVSARYMDPDRFMASFTTLSANNEPKMGTITVYNRVTGEPYCWHGQIPELSSNMQYENGLTVELAKLNLLPNSAKIKLHNRGFCISNSPTKVIVGAPELNDIHITIFVQVHD